jgi:hypothetical protein
MERRIRLSAIIFFACTVLCLQAASQIGKTQKVTQIKLENFGWEPVPTGEHHEDTGIVSRNLWIDHKGRVLVGFTVRENISLATREHPGHSLRILRFTEEGKPDLSVVLPTDNWYFNGFYLGPNDQIFARANDKFQLFIKDASHKEEGTWETLAPCPRSCSISQSFSRRTLILRVGEPFGDERPTYTIIDAFSSPPRVVRTCSQMASLAWRVTDKFVYVGNYDRDDDLMVRFPFCDVEHYEDFPMWGRHAYGYVLNDETLLKVESTGARLLGPDGEIKFSCQMPKHDSLNSDRVATDERYDRFAFMVNTKRGENRRLDIGGDLVARRVTVYSATGQELASVPLSTTYHRDLDFSMSPDGTLLAVLENGKLSLFKLEE